MKRSRLIALCTFFAVTAACDEPEPTTTAETTQGDTSADATVTSDGAQDSETTLDVADSLDIVEPVQCRPSSRWSPGTSAFTEATEAWGLDALGVEGTRVNAIDYDGDGWPDLLIRRGSEAPDDFAEGGVRRTWLLRNDRAGGFEDVTVSSGLLQTRESYPGETAPGRPGSVYAAADVNNDGHLDFYSGLNTSASPDLTLDETSEILLGDGAGGFTLGPLGDHRTNFGVTVPAGASFTDVNRDGFVDLWVPQHNYQGSNGQTVFLQDYLYLGDGTGAFTNAVATYGLTTYDWISIGTINNAAAHTRAWSALACDLNNDGVPELLAGSYGRSPNHLWQGTWSLDGLLGYFPRSVPSGYAFDDDQTWSDNQFARCYCSSAPGLPGCEGVPASDLTCPNPPNWSHDTDREPFRLGGNSGATVCADINNDGYMDLLTTEIKHWWAGAGADGSEVLVNAKKGNVLFERPGDDALGLAIAHPSANWDEGHMSATMFDFDNDGWTDIYIGGSDYAGNRGLLYHQSSPLSFTELSTSEFFEHNRSHGVAVADFDRDGDLDIVVGHSRARCDANAPNNCYDTSQVRLFENTIGQDGNFMQLQLVGAAGTNLAAIGARATVVLPDGTRMMQDVGGGYGHYGAQNDLTLHFGLAGACTAEVTIRWPDFTKTTETISLDGNARYRWVQGEAPVVVTD